MFILTMFAAAIHWTHRVPGTLHEWIASDTGHVYATRGIAVAHELLYLVRH